MTTLRSENGLATVRVSDRGPGVPRGSEEKIFEQFCRAHSSLNSGIQGAELGLTLARQIARANGGDVLRAGPGRWKSIFPDAQCRRSRMKTKILIVEDDPNIRFGLEEVLEAEGFAITVCEREDHAVDAVLEEEPALVLLDVRESLTARELHLHQIFIKLGIKSFRETGCSP